MYIASYKSCDPTKVILCYTPLRFPLRLHPQESAELLRVGAALMVGEVQEARHTLSQAVGDPVHPEEATQEAEPARGWGLQLKGIHMTKKTVVKLGGIIMNNIL